MGDKKGKKDKAKEHRQSEAKHDKAEKQAHDRQQTGTTADSQVRGLSNSRRRH